jgi:hypothetical protein
MVTVQRRAKQQVVGGDWHRLGVSNNGRNVLLEDAFKDVNWLGRAEVYELLPSEAVKLAHELLDEAAMVERMSEPLHGLRAVRR